MSKRRSLHVSGDISTEEKLICAEAWAQRLIDERLADYATRAIMDGASEGEVMAFVEQNRAECHQALRLQLVEIQAEIEDDPTAVRH